MHSILDYITVTATSELSVMIADRKRLHAPSVDDNGLKDELRGSHEKFSFKENCFQHFILRSKAQLTCASAGITILH